MHHFAAILQIIDGNPYVFVPQPILEQIFIQAGRAKQPIPIRGFINEKAYQQTLMKYKGEWRLYINMQMLKDSPRRVGEEILVKVEYDPKDRTIKANPKFLQALNMNPKAKATFEQLTPSRQKEILRYIAHLKTEASIDKNVARAIRFLHGKDRFVGRDKP